MSCRAKEIEVPICWNILFVPSNSSHIGKNRLLLDTLQERGCRVRMLCLDEVQSPKYATQPQMEKSGFDYDMLSVPGFRSGRHWLIKGLQRGVLVRNLRRFFRGRQFDAVIFGADSGIVSRTTGNVAQSLGIPTVLVVDGLVTVRNPRYRESFLESMKSGIARVVMRWLRAGGEGRTSGSDLLLVINEQGRRQLLEHGVDGDRVRVVGSPEYDGLAKEVRETRTADLEVGIRAKIGLPGDGPVIFFAHQDVGESPERMQRSVLHMVAAARRCGGTVLVKFHPRGRDQPDQWRAWARSENLTGREVVFCTNECTSIEAVKICAVCVTFFSTVSIEAMACGKPVIFMVYHNFPDTLSSADVHGGALDAENPEDLERKIILVLSDCEVRQELLHKASVSLEKEMFSLDGRSIDRSISAIMDLVQSRKDARHNAPGGSNK